MTPEVINKLEEAFLMDCSILEACFYSGITKQTYYNYINDNPSFLSRIETLRENPVFQARKAVVSRLPDDPNLSLKYLEKKKKDEFGQSQDINVNVFHSLSDDQLESRIKQLESKHVQQIEDVQEADYTESGQ